MINFQFTIRVEKCRQLNTPSLRNLLTREIRAKHATDAYICFENVFQPTIAKLLLNMPVDVKTVNPNAWIKLPRGLSDELLEKELVKIMEGLNSIKEGESEEFEPAITTPFDETQNTTYLDSEDHVPVYEDNDTDQADYNETNYDDSNLENESIQPALVYENDNAQMDDNELNYGSPSSILEDNYTSNPNSESDDLNVDSQDTVEKDIPQPQKNTVVIQRNNNRSNNNQQYHNNNNQNRSNYRK